MEKGINLTIFETKSEIAKIINDCRLPVSVVRQIIKEIDNEVSVLEKQQIKKEQEEYNEKLKAQKEEKVEGNI